MLFKDYLEKVNKYAEEHPESLELNVRYFHRDCRYVYIEGKIQQGFFKDDAFCDEEELYDIMCEEDRVAIFGINNPILNTVCLR